MCIPENNETYCTNDSIFTIHHCALITNAVLYQVQLYLQIELILSQKSVIKNRRSIIEFKPIKI
jgi:hypothetical protein